MVCIHIPDGILCVAEQMVFMDIGTAKPIAFEPHNYFGPIHVSAKTGDPLSQDFPRVFWAQYQKWDEQGREVDANRNAVISH